MSWVYLAALVLAALGIGAIDARWRLALFADAWRAIVAVGVGALVLLLIDLGGIASGNFRLGESEWMTGFEVLPHLPLEELVFIVFLAYVSLVAVCGARTAIERRSERR